MKGARLPIARHLFPLRQQLRRKALVLRDSLDLDRDRVDRLLEMLEAILVDARLLGGAMGAKEDYARRNPDEGEGSDRDHYPGADLKEAENVRIHMEAFAKA
jgi:hypothetical protein